jgi:hypothetical protein
MTHESGKIRSACLIPNEQLKIDLFTVAGAHNKRFGESARLCNQLIIDE